MWQAEQMHELAELCEALHCFSASVTALLSELYFAEAQFEWTQFADVISNATCGVGTCSKCLCELIAMGTALPHVLNYAYQSQNARVCLMLHQLGISHQKRTKKHSCAMLTVY